MKIMKILSEPGRFKLLLFFSVIFVLILSKDARAENCLGWTDTAVKLLPDSSFASIELQPENNNTSVTSKKRIRHCPYRDAKGKIDYEQLIYELGTFNKEIWLNKENREAALKLLKVHYNSFVKGSMKNNNINEMLNINTARLTDLVLLPRIGPVLAVKIACYRKTHTPFKSIEDIKQIEGIGQGTFNSVRHYISIR